MIEIRKSAERGHLNFGWLDTHHSFSFGEYHDPAHMNFRALRVINEDRIAPGAGFPTHPHRDMEIITYVVGGAVAHEDSTGSSGVTPAGDVQRMSAGTGIRHSEFNPSDTEPTHLLQIWILPDGEGHQPGYEQKNFPREQKRGRLLLIASPDGAEGSVRLNQDASVYATVLGAGERVTHTLSPGRHAWVQVVSGEVEVNGEALQAGDGAAISHERNVGLSAVGAETELILFDLP